MAWETEKIKLTENIVAKGIAEGLRNPEKAQYIVAEIDQNIIGSLMITEEWSDWRNGRFWWIQSVFIEKNYRKQGVFAQLLDFVRNEAKQQSNVLGLKLYVDKDNETAQKAYKKMGFNTHNYILMED